MSARPPLRSPHLPQTNDTNNVHSKYTQNWYVIMMILIVDNEHDSDMIHPVPAFLLVGAAAEKGGAWVGSASDLCGWLCLCLPLPLPPASDLCGCLRLCLCPLPLPPCPHLPVGLTFWLPGWPERTGRAATQVDANGAPARRRGYAHFMFAPPPAQDNNAN